jgi:hypothetical protein
MFKCMYSFINLLSLNRTYLDIFYTDGFYLTGNSRRHKESWRGLLTTALFQEQHCT